jgi:hypothetical protein
MDEVQMVREFGSHVTGDVDAARLNARATLERAMSGRGGTFVERRETSVPRVRRLALSAAAALLLLAIPASALAPKVASWLNSLKDPDAPVATAPDVIIAMGTSGVEWKLVATDSDQGLCLVLTYTYEGDHFGDGGCGDWGEDIYGYPSASSNGRGVAGQALHWVEGTPGGSSSAGLTRAIVKGVAATDVATVDLVLQDGQVMRANLVEQPEGIAEPVNFWWAELPRHVEGQERTEPPVHALVARDASGQVLERRIVDDPELWK